MRRIGLVVATLGAFAALPPLGCSTDPPPEVQPKQKSEAILSSWGAEKLIPLRFVNLLTCTPGTTGCNDQVAYDVLLESVTKANQVYKAAGIQFWIREITRFRAPNFVDPTSTTNIQWGGSGSGDDTAYGELKDVFPGIPADAWTPSWVTKKPSEWLGATAAVYAPENEIHIWVLANGLGSSFPENARSLRVSAELNGKPYMLAHELGHYFGLTHSWEISADSVDPETLAARKKSDAWDLVYKPGTDDVSNPHVFYSDRASAAANEASLAWVWTTDGSRGTPFPQRGARDVRRVAA